MGIAADYLPISAICQRSTHWIHLQTGNPQSSTPQHYYFNSVIGGEVHRFVEWLWFVDGSNTLRVNLLKYDSDIFMSVVDSSKVRPSGVPSFLL